MSTRSWASLENEVGHSYADVMRFITYDRQDWGRELLQSLWADAKLREELRKVALIDLLFESPDSATLYGFFAVSKRLYPLNGESHIETYRATLRALFNEDITVGSHAVFREGLPNVHDSDALLKSWAHLQAARQEDKVLSENYLYSQVSLRARPLSELGEISDAADLLDYGEVRSSDPIGQEDKLNRLRKESEDDDVEENWQRFLKDLTSAFESTGEPIEKIDMFAIPIVTRDADADRRATGALFFGSFVS